MSVKVWSQVWKYSQQRGGARLILLALADYANNEGLAWPSVLSLALKTLLTERQVRNILVQLERAGELEIIRGGGRGRTNLYRLKIFQGNQNTENITPKSTQENPEISDTETLKSPDTRPVNRNHHYEPSIEPSSDENGSRHSRQKTPKNLTKTTDAQTSEVMAWLEAQRGYPSPRYAAEGRAIQWMLAQGYTPGQIQTI